MLYFASISISIYLLLLFIGKPHKSIADKLLMVWQFLATLHLADLYWLISGNYRSYPLFLGWGAPLPLVHGPFLYLYILYLTRPLQFNFKSLLHFIPVVLAIAVWLPFSVQTPVQKLQLFEEGMLPYRWLALGFNIAIAISGISYVLASCLLLYRYKHKIGQVFSTTDHISLNWLRYLIAGIGIIWLFVIFYQTPQTIYLSASLYICFIGYFGVRQKQIFRTPAAPVSYNENVATADITTMPAISEPGVETEEIIPAPAKAKYDWSSLSEAEAERIHIQLQEIMERDQLYKNPELTLDDLAGALQVSEAALSQVINSRFNQSFYDYINSLRVAAFIKQAADPGNKGYTLLSIAFDCGFNSKSSFNRNFRKFTGKSPSGYLKTNT
ncbi:helix-turn-helix domain-containing protein [Niabella sp. 22666]|uniref:helix-turn-helix domain-containing protein n=1 Tax=Niabella sp. 22666 TaxID=3453954 RepID=UPI003F87B82B